MPGKLTALEVEGLIKPGMYYDGDGPYVQVRGPKWRSWIFRCMVAPATSAWGPYAKSRFPTRAAEPGSARDRSATGLTL